MLNSFIEYVKETKAELKHVSWPTQKQTINFTIAVIAISVAVALALALFDRGYVAVLEKMFFNY